MTGLEIFFLLFSLLIVMWGLTFFQTLMMKKMKKQMLFLKNLEEWVDLWQTDELKNYPLPKVEGV